MVCETGRGCCTFSYRRSFRLSPLMHLRQVFRSFDKKSHVNSGVRKPGNRCVTDHHNMPIAVKMALNDNANKQSKWGSAKKKSKTS